MDGEDGIGTTPALILRTLITLERVVFRLEHRRCMQGLLSQVEDLTILLDFCFLLQDFLWGKTVCGVALDAAVIISCWK